MDALQPSPETRTPYCLGKRVDAGFEDALDLVTIGLAREGFGVLTRIDVAATLQAKLGVRRSPYVILGVCHPEFAHRALQIEPALGTLLPCSVVVRQDHHPGVIVEMTDPLALMRLAERPAVGRIAAELRSRLEQVLAGL